MSTSIKSTPSLATPTRTASAAAPGKASSTSTSASASANTSARRCSSIQDVFSQAVAGINAQAALKQSWLDALSWDTCWYPAGDQPHLDEELNRGPCHDPEMPDVSVLMELWNLDQTWGPISGDQLADAIIRGVGDLDGQAAGKEFEMFMNWAMRNCHRLSPEARQVLDIYRRYAQAAQQHGLSGIPQSWFQQMVWEMRASLQPRLEMSALRASSIIG